MNPHPATLDEPALLATCRLSTTRRSGPGGQHRNKVETAVIAEHLPSGIAAEASEQRSQGANRLRAIQRLRVKLAIELRSPAADSPSPLWQSRVSGGKLAVNPEHTAYPSLLAEALDHLAACDFNDQTAAQRLAISRTQLIRFLKITPAALAMLNAARSERGLHPLR